VDTAKPTPDLLSTASNSGGGKRILAQLEHGAKPHAKRGVAARWTIDGWTVGLCALLLLMFSVAWMMHEKMITPSTFKAGHGGAAATARGESRMTKRMPAATGQHAATSTGASTGLPLRQPTGQAAVIINEPAGMTAASAATTPSAIARTEALAAAAPATRVLAQAPPVRTAPATLRTAPTSARQTATTSSAAAPAAHSADTDVILLTALVAHTGKPAAVAPDRNRDIVERHEGDSTAQLLARCKQLGLIEGMLCRSRICSGRWEADAACRAPAH
jgi:hypothetical protein